MSEWKKVKLGDLFERVTRKNTNLESNNVLTISAQYGLINQEDFFNKSVAGKNLKNYYLLKKGEFAYNKSYSTGYPMGATKMLEKYDCGVVSTLYICFKSKSDLVNNEYFKYYFESKQYYDELSKIAQEGARNHGLLNISVDDFFNMQVILPTIEEQTQIVSILNKIDMIIRQIQLKKDTYNNYKLYLMNINLKKYQNEVTIDNIFEKITDYVAAGSFADLKNNVKYNSEKDYAQLIRTVDIKNKFSNNEFVYISKSAFNYLWRVNLDEDNIVLPNIGANIGEVYYIRPLDLPYENNVLGPNAILIGKCKNLKFMYYYFQTKDFQNKLHLIVGASGQPKFNKTDLKKIKINLPNEEVQNDIVKILEKHDLTIELLTKQIQEYDNLKRGLMQKLLTGKVRVKI